MGLTRENLLEPMFGKGGEHAVRAFLLEEVKRGAIVLAYR